MYDIFISYRTTHSNWVETLAHNLKAQNYSVFLDHWELIPGQDFTVKIHDALKDARCAILVATPDTSDSGWVQQELQMMINRKNSGSGFFFIPVVMGQFPDLPFVENVQAVDFGDSHPEVYRRAFQRLLCGIEQVPPTFEVSFEGELRFPYSLSSLGRPLVQSEHTFLEEVFKQLETAQPLMILAQADTNTQIYAHTLRKRAKTLFGSDNVYHIFPPNSTRADSAAYYGRLAKQCHFEGEISESWQWGEALANKLEEVKNLFLLVTGFENGADESRAELAGELRQLKERYPAFHLTMMGGKRLAALKYAHGSMSLLNVSEELHIPELDSRDLPAIFGHLYPGLKLTPKQLQALLEFTGCHPRLLHHCLQKGANSAQTCENILKQSPLPAQLFTHFRDKRDRIPLCTFLSQCNLGKFDPWPSDKLLRKLYWNNLITRRRSDFSWRCEFIRQTGREMLECK
jgi:hypothetical protein